MRPFWLRRPSAVNCAALGVSGTVDEVVSSSVSPVPVEVKFTEGGVAFGHKVQLVVYGMALEEEGSREIPRGFVHLVPSRRTVAVMFDSNLRAAARDVVRRIREMLENQDFPPPADRPAKCDGCELRCFCNDVY